MVGRRSATSSARSRQQTRSLSAWPSRSATLPISPSRTSLLSFFNASAQLQIAIDITVTAQIIALRGATELGTSAEEAPIFEDGVWRYIEVELFINNSTGYDGALILNVANADTQNQSGDDIAVVRLWGCESGNAVTVFAYNDIYCTNEGTRLGECRVRTLVPTSDTADADWTAAWRRRSLCRGG
jgi:hypothetical protein